MEYEIMNFIESPAIWAVIALQYLLCRRFCVRAASSKAKLLYVQVQVL